MAAHRADGVTPAPRRRQAERREATRAELLAAAARVFARRGFGGASIDDIAAEAGFSSGAIYWHFKGKEELFLAVFEERAAGRARELAAALGEGGGPLPARARRAADQWMERLSEDPDGFRLSLEFANYVADRPQLEGPFAERLSRIRLAIAAELEAATAAGELALPLPADDVAVAIRALGIGLAFEKLTEPAAVRDELFGELLELVLERLRPL